MRVVGLVQSKGGVGKTTTALNLGAELTRRGLTVQLFDADPAGHAVAIAEDGRLPFTVAAHLLEEAAEIGAWVQTVRGASADVALIDAPGAMGLAYGATLAVADIVLVPAGATVMELRGAGETIRLVRQHRRERAASRPSIMVVPSRIDRRTAAGREAVATLAELGEPVAPPVSARAVVADSLAEGEPVPAGSASAAEFAALADAILARLSSIGGR